MFKKVVNNTLAQITAKGITATSTLLITILIGKSLGPHGYGEFTKIFVFVGYFYTLSDFGLNTIYIKLAKEKESSLIKNLFGLRLIISTTLAIFAVLIALFLPYNEVQSLGFSPAAKIGIAIAALTIITHALFTSANAFFQKNLRYDLSAIASISGTLLILLLTYINFMSKNSLFLFISFYVAGGIVFVTTSILLIFLKFKEFLYPTFDTESFKSLVIKSTPVGLALFFNLIYFRADIFILSLTRTTTEVGIYGLAYQFFEAALSIPIFISNALYPLLSNLKQKSSQEFKKQSRLWLFYLLAVSMMLTVALFIAAQLIPTFFDLRFKDSQYALYILALGMPFFFISALLWHLLIINNRQKYLVAIYASGAVFNVLANIFFIPIYGYIAASTITVISEILITLLLTLFLLKKT